MKRLGAAASAAALLGALAISSPALAFGGFWGHGWNGGGWQVDGWHGGWCLPPLDHGYGRAGGWNCDYSYDYRDDHGYPGYAYAPGYYEIAPQVSMTAPFVAGRSVAEGVGDFCSTPVRTCQLIHASYVGAGCSCQVPGGRARGSVTP